MQSPFIRLEFKQTKEVDWITPIHKWISNNYQGGDYSKEEQKLDRLRQDMRGAGRDATGRDLLYRYYMQIDNLEKRLPVDEYHVKVLFTWYDCFSKKETGQYSLAYEKASTLHNLSACLSAIAAGQERQEGTGASAAYRGLRAAVGVLQYINDNFLHAPSVDLSKETVTVLVTLMLSQAQECLLERGEGKSEALLAKLAAWLAFQYNNLYDGVQDGIQRGAFYGEWAKLCQIKGRYFGAIANRHRAAMVNGEGEAVARLQSAQNQAKEAHKLAQQFANSFVHSACPTIPADGATAMTELTRILHLQLSELLTKAEKENALIYHVPVPQVDSLSPLDKSCAVMPMTMADYYGEDEPRVAGTPIFFRLLPDHVHEQASVYSEKKATLIRQTAEKCEQADAELAGLLAFLCLPQSLDRFRPVANENDVCLNAAAREPHDEIRGLSGWVQQEESQPLSEITEQLNAVRQNSQSLCRKIEQLLDQEATEWQQHQTRLSYEQNPPDAALRDRLAALRVRLDRLTESHRQQMRGLADNAEYVMILSQGPRSPELERIYCEAVGGRQLVLAPAANLSPLIARVDDAVSRLQRLQKERSETLDDLRARAHKDDISQLLLKGSSDALVSRELQKFDPHCTRVSACCAKQQALVTDLTEAFRALVESHDGKAVVRGIEKAEKSIADLETKLKAAAEAFRLAKDGVRSFLPACLDISEAFNVLLADVTRSVAVRREERTKLARDAAMALPNVPVQTIQRVHQLPNIPQMQAAPNMPIQQMPNIQPIQNMPMPHFQQMYPMQNQQMYPQQPQQPQHMMHMQPLQPHPMHHMPIAQQPAGQNMHQMNIHPAQKQPNNQSSQQYYHSSGSLMD